MKKRILVRVDFQNDFVDPDGKLTINDVALINRHQRFCNSLQRGMFAEVIDIADTHFEETYAATAEAADYPLHAAYYTWGWHKAAEFKDNIPLTNLYKSTTNIWNEENNYTLLRQDWRDKDIYLCGLLSDVCVREAMDGFLNRGTKVTLLEDLCKGVRATVAGDYCGAAICGIFDRRATAHDEFGAVFQNDTERKEATV